jgi:hypothetical protein
MAKYLNDFRQGDTYKIKLNYGSDVDITDYEYWFVLKSSFELEDLDAELVTHTVAGDYVGDTPSTGVVYIVTDAISSLDTPSGKYYYGLKEISPTGEVRTLVPPPEDYKDRLVVAPKLSDDL